ncbi:ubiquitin-protein transferase [Aureococcus anophagefferens]|uniref:HECT-type E3 ubiquitin transferase n=1 Tax=Aureococcus anophagefferens TaxID=44056 RepID=A0ABR1G0N3_AURAN
MDWKERQTTKKKDDTVEKARLAREARAQQRQQVKPALALGRAARGFLARRRVARLCGERVDRKLGDILKLKAFLATAGKNFVAPAETAAPLLREVAFATPDAARLARVCEAVLVPGLSEAPAGDARLDLGAGRRRGAPLAPSAVPRQLWAAGLAGRAPALVDAVGLLVTRAAFLAHRLVDLWVDDGRARRRAVDAGYDRAAKLEPRESGDRAVDGSVASAVAIAAGGAADAGRGGLFAQRLWPARCSATSLGRGRREALATRGTRDALAELATRPPAGGSERSGVDAAAWLLGALGALGRRLLVEGASRPFALAVAAALAATDNAAAVLCDEDAVICWKVVNGAKQPAVVAGASGCGGTRVAELEAREGVVAPLADALIAKRDCAFLDASSAADDALDADLAGLSRTPLLEAAAKKKRPLGASSASASPPCPRLRVAALTALAFHDDGPRRLWGYLQARHARALAPSLERYFGAASAPNPPPRDVVVALACVALLRHALLIVDDDELRDRSRPAAPFQLRRVAEALKRGLFAHCWREGGPDRRRDAYGGWCAALLHDLHARSCRRPFARPALWLVAEADEGAAREELRKGATRRSRLLLASMPFALPFRARVRLFQEKVCPDGQSNARAEEIRFFDASSPRPTDKTIVRVRRSHVLDDGLDRIAGLSPAALKGRLSVAFVDDWGRAEAGIDAGGLFKEFWTELSGAAFSMDFGLFKTTAHDGLLFPNPDSAFVHGERDHLRLFHFLGRVLGKALREGITIQPRFTRSFLSFVRGDFNYVTLLEDLKSLDPDLHRNLKFLQLYDGDVADLGLDFSVSFDRFGECVTANLIPNGADVEVTRANRHAYVQAVANRATKG